MIGWVILVPVLAYLVLTGVAGLAMRLKRAGMASGISTPSVRLMPWFGVTLGLFWYMLTWEWTGLLLGFAVGAGFFLVALGWDELYDRICPAFYACVRREVGTFFSTPIPYFVLVLFLLLSGFFFWGSLEASQQVSFRPVFRNVSFFGFFLFPLLTMGLFARERSEGTIEALMTAPVSDTAVAVSKFLGTMAFYVAMLLPTVVYFVILRYIGRDIGKPDVGPVISAYVGMILLGGLFASLGLFTSSLSQSQILAALFSWVIIIFFLIAGDLAGLMGISEMGLGSVLEYVGHMNHQEAFFRGVIEPRDVIYFLSFTVFFLFLSVRAIESRKWR
ncbi:MAG: ABC transporter permease [Planctomycetota bacterium]|jgi:ABC-2 type transport system permease protein